MPKVKAKKKRPAFTSAEKRMLHEHAKIIARLSKELREANQRVYALELRVMREALT